MAQPRLLERVETNHGGASKRSAELGADHVDFGRGVKEDKAKAERHLFLAYAQLSPARRYASMGGSSNRPVQDGAKELEGDVKAIMVWFRLTSPSSSFAPS
jgi:hypothetical protein